MHQQADWIIRKGILRRALHAWADNITLLTDLFLRLIKMVIAPLVFSTLTVGIMRLGE
ncbi:cation:dicarboxylase symporter family transporter, partial [Klebsiella pneumoniae]|uniref:cation:dicarboxylate symporter family transporter n=1 Tax=Klebsiella pneumoniae TaxID=573 RepID=UPI00210B6734